MHGRIRLAVASQGQLSGRCPCGETVKRVAFVVFATVASSVTAQPVSMRVHDPRLARQDDTFHVFSTGVGIPTWTSRDLVHWQPDGPVFPAPPSWAVKAYMTTNYLWSPDVARFNGKYHLYFAVSPQFGQNNSAIGQATNVTLDRDDQRYAWADQGIVVRTTAADDWNAIDPAIYIDTDKTPWMVAGSFWSGIKLIRLDPETGGRADDRLIPLVRRRPPDAIEAGCIFHHRDFYYLMVSFDYCCRGARSNYQLRVGRSHHIDGPYFDFDGNPMLEGGGTLLLASCGSVRGPGHAGVFDGGALQLLVHHFYDADENGRSKLQIQPLLWPNDGWPLVGESLAETTSATTRPASVVGRWKYSTDFGEPFSVQLLDDGTTRPDVGRWAADHDSLTFAFPGKKQRSTTLRCFLSDDRRLIIGRNDEGAIIRLDRP